MNYILLAIPLLLIGFSSAFALGEPVSHWKFDFNTNDFILQNSKLENSFPVRLCIDNITNYCVSPEQQIGNLNFADGIINGSHRFDGYTWFATNDESRFDFDTQDSKSFSFWYKSDEWTGHVYLITKKGDLEDSHKVGYSIGITEEGKIWYEQRSTNEILYATTNFDSSSSDKWTHVTIVDHGTGFIDDILFYVDGVNVKTDPKEIASTLDYMSTSMLNDEPLFIGSFRGWYGWNFIGYLDDVRIYNYALTTDQVRSIYLENQSKLEISPLQQHKSGIPIDNIKCSPHLTLIKNPYNEKPACVKSYTAFRLLEQGWKTT